MTGPTGGRAVVQQQLFSSCPRSQAHWDPAQTTNTLRTCTGTSESNKNIRNGADTGLFLRHIKLKKGRENNYFFLSLPYFDYYCSQCNQD
jgi:hypothetical protein